MKKVKSAVAISSLGLILLVSLGGFSHGVLQVGFYRGKCEIVDVEMTVARVVTARFFRDPTIVPALLRLQFHDCFVNGCDASILIDGSNSEKTAIPNLRLRGYDIIDEAKAAVDRVCPGVVSCADLIAIAARDAVFWGGGGRCKVQTGRRDGLISLAENVSLFLLNPSDSVSQTIALFANKGLTATDMVLLMGAHSVGVAHCSSFIDRLYNFRNTSNPDPSIDPFLAPLLRFWCPENTTTNNRVSLDQNPSPFLDKSYYKQLILNRGILKIDQELASDPLTRATVISLANVFDFPTQFGAAMVKMGGIEVLTGMQGEIRRSCTAINPSPST
ncbi:Peroxidase [Melia azedarach]|uniref:Peroxidase n=1 Tax=Melia azedarach TaxID=155640 RepID=A0ACC1YYV9_MELAZ|nr:Peroxidase [Melia azedarach]